MDTYDQDPTEYVEGARYCLDKGDARHLAYAALELRRFVEARQYEYLIAQKKYRESLPKTHEISGQFRALQRVYNQERTQILLHQFRNGFEYEFRFAPVTEDLKNRAERMSEWLHAPKKAADEASVTAFRAFAEQTYTLAEVVNAGNLLCPALLIGDSTVGDLIAKIPKEDSEALSAQLSVGAEMLVKVRYE